MTTSMKEKLYLHNCEKGQIREYAKLVGDQEVICKYKRTFFKRSDAKQFIKRLNAIHKLCVYQCKVCNFWHTSTKRK